MSDKEKADLEERLDHCRAQIVVQVAFLNKHSLDDLIESANGNTAKLGQLRDNVQYLHDNVEDLSQGVQVAGFSAETQEQIRRLMDVQEDAFSAIVQRRILSSLEFDGIYDRSDMVEETYLHTFRWILDDHDGGTCFCPFFRFRCDESDELGEFAHSMEDDAMCLASENFTNWLSSGEGVFHISGKMGSGKSTLMKYLGDHKRTHAELLKWAGKQHHLCGLCRNSCDTHSP